MSEKIENLLEENRKFSPSESLTKNANATSSWFQEANENRLEFWKKQALERITWFKETTAEFRFDSNSFLWARSTAIRCLIRVENRIFNKQLRSEFLI